LEHLRQSRNQEICAAILVTIKEIANGDENLFPHVLEAVKAGCTLGEIMQAMKDVFGTWMAPSGF
jgi:methylmalonyl-CoA mutase N-terminal domain/subunit